VEKVTYPGLPSHPCHEIAKRQMTSYDGTFAPGAMVYFEVKGDDEEGRERGRRFCNHIAEHAYVLTLAVSLGQIRTLVEHPAGMTHAMLPADARQAQGIAPGGVRLSVGIEPLEDLRNDLGAALDVC
jgi:cystathionine beta-lyase/cystathionine gamma-synthase